MQITEEFIRSEIADIEREMGNAREFLIKAQAAIDVHRMLLDRLSKPEPIVEDTNGHIPEAPQTRD